MRRLAGTFDRSGELRDYFTYPPNFERYVDDAWQVRVAFHHSSAHGWFRDTWETYIQVIGEDGLLFIFAAF